jgi:hypothetical protein
LPYLPGSILYISPYFISPSPARKGLTPPLFRIEPGVFYYENYYTSTSYYLDFEFNLNDMYEVMAYASEARTIPLGVLGETGVLENKLNLLDIWLGDSDPNNGHGIYGHPKWHSAEFNFNYMTQSVYWSHLLGRDGFFIFQDR